LAGPEAPILHAYDMIVPDSFRVSELDSRHSVVHGVTVALYQFFLLWLSTNAIGVKKVFEPNWTCAEAVCQLIPGGA